MRYFNDSCRNLSMHKNFVKLENEGTKVAKLKEIGTNSFKAMKYQLICIKLAANMLKLKCQWLIGCYLLAQRM